jgi:hypothetical protein
MAARKTTPRRKAKKVNAPRTKQRPEDGRLALANCADHATSISAHLYACRLICDDTDHTPQIVAIRRLVFEAELFSDRIRRHAEHWIGQLTR